MNQFIAHGRIVYKEPPKEAGRSSLITLKVGKPKEDNGAPIQSTNQVIVRLPPHLAQHAEQMAVDDYVEVIGHVTGLARRSMGTGKMHLYPELAANRIERATLVNEGQVRGVERLLFNSFQATGLVAGAVPPHKEGAPANLYLQVARHFRDIGRPVQRSAVVPIAAYGRLAERVVEYEKGQAVFIGGRIMGLLRKVPTPGGGYEANLEVGMIAEQARLTAVVPHRMTLPPAGDEPDGGDDEAKTSDDADGEEGSAAKSEGAV